jgi:hypothetical protein
MLLNEANIYNALSIYTGIPFRSFPKFYQYYVPSAEAFDQDYSGNNGGVGGGGDDLTRKSRKPSEY